MLFTEATIEGTGTLRQILSEYEVCSGQSINYEKSTIFFSKNTRAQDRDSMSGFLIIRPSNDMERYLGLPNVVGRKKKLVFQTIKDCFRQRIDNWSTKMLSQGGKEVFIKAVLQAIPTYSMMCFLLPKSFCGELEHIIAKF